MHLVEDVRYALRQFINAPGFTATAVLTLALGIGATTAIFTLVHAVLLNSLPVAKPSELYRIGNNENCCVNGGLQNEWSLFSYDKYKTFRDNTPGFAELAAFQAGNSLVGVRRVGSNQPAQSQRSEYVSGNYFTMFGIGAYAGRVLNPRDDVKGAAPVVVMSYRTWQQKYGHDPSLIGASLAINGQPFTVIGIAPAGFFGDRLQNPPEFWIPLSDEPIVSGANSYLDMAETDWLDVIGRIAPGVDPRPIEARMRVELQQWLLSPVSKLGAGNRALVPKQTLHFSPGGAGVQAMRDEYQGGLRLLMTVSAFVLIIACANVANLMLVRAATRKQQTAIRAALGASRTRQIAMALTESSVLALLGGVLGVALAFAGTKLILHLAFPSTEVAIAATPSLPVLAFTFALTLLTGILFGVAPAWSTATADPADALHGANRSTAGSGTWVQKALVIAQAALSLVLLCAAGLLTQSLSNIRHQQFGIETQDRYILHIEPQMAGYKVPELPALYRQLRESLMRVPGVEKVAFSLYSPMEGNNYGETVYIAGQAPPPPDSPENSASWVRVSEDYFDVVGTKILQGRPVTREDTPTTRNVAVVNQAFAKKFFANESAIGQHFGVFDVKNAGTFEIVGVTGDTQYREPTRPIGPMFFLPSDQHVIYDDQRFNTYENSSHYLGAVELKTQGNVQELESKVRLALGQVNSDLAVIDFMSFADQVQGNFTQQDMIAKLTSLFGLLALALASVGLYGVTAYSVERRTNEIGIRMALGADRANVFGLVLRGAFLQVGIGLMIGLPAVVLGGRAMASQLFGVKPYDPNILLLTTAVLGIATFVAAVVPARWASSLEPMRALRSE
jgi:predicted permease